MNYPSRKIIWAIIAALVIVLAAFAFNEYKNALPAQTKYAPPVAYGTSVSTSSAVIADSDWQKVLVGAGISNQTQNSSLNSGTSSAISQPLTATDKLGEALFSQYAQLEEAGAATDPTSINNAVSNTLANDAIFTKPKTYTLADINISNNSTSDALRAYANTVAMILQSHNQNDGSEASIATQAISNNDPAMLAQIDPIIADYQKIVTKLVNVMVPESIAKAHIDLLNSMSMILSSAQLLRHSDTDAVGGLQATVQEQASLQQTAAAIDEIGNVLKASDVQFSADDPGATLEIYIDPTTIGGNSNTNAQS